MDFNLLWFLILVFLEYLKIEDDVDKKKQYFNPPRKKKKYYDFEMSFAYFSLRFQLKFSSIFFS